MFVCVEYKRPSCTFSHCLQIVPAPNCNMSVTVESDVTNTVLAVKISSSSFERSSQQYMLRTSSFQTVTCLQQMVFVNFHLERFRRILCTVDCGMLNCSELVLFPTVTFHVTGNFPFTNATSLFEQLRYTTLMGIFVGGSVPKFIQNILCTVIILYGL